MWLFLLICGCALGATGVSQFSITRAHLFALRTQEAEAGLRAVFSVLDAYHDDVVAGRQTLGKAQTAVRKLLLAYRFAEGEGYVTVLDDAHVVLIHPADRAIEGSFGKLALDGRDFGREAVEIGKKGGFGVTTYPDSNPYSGEPDTTTSVIARFEPWGWTLVAGAFNQRFDGTMTLLAYRAIAEFSALMLILIAAASVTAGRIVWPMLDLAQAAEAMADGAPGGAVPHRTRGDELGRIARALHRLGEGA